jgi:hypothetical protein
MCCASDAPLEASNCALSHVNTASWDKQLFTESTLDKLQDCFSSIHCVRYIIRRLLIDSTHHVLYSARPVLVQKRNVQSFIPLMKLYLK